MSRGPRDRTQQEVRSLEDQPGKPDVMGDQSKGPIDRKKKKRRASSSREGTEIKLETFSLFWPLSNIRRLKIVSLKRFQKSVCHLPERRVSTPSDDTYAMQYLLLFFEI